jgi:hypothetical protein
LLLLLLLLGRVCAAVRRVASALLLLRVGRTSLLASLWLCLRLRLLILLVPATALSARSTGLLLLLWIGRTTCTALLLRVGGAALLASLHLLWLLLLGVCRAGRTRRLPRRLRR